MIVRGERLYHIGGEDLGKYAILTPTRGMWSNEDAVSFAPSIKKCALAIGEVTDTDAAIKYGRLPVYQPIGKISVHRPTIDDEGFYEDLEMTGEVRSSAPVRAVRVGWIIISPDRGSWRFVRE